MRRYLTLSSVALCLHVAAALAIRPYRDALIDLGRRLVHANDISDILNAFMAGFSVVAALLLGTTLVVVYVIGLRTKQ